MHITFLGTKGGITIHSPLHFMNSSLLIRVKKTRLLIDWGSDWITKEPPHVDALFLTHAHDDHAGGIKEGFPAPVYASAETWQRVSVPPELIQNTVTPYSEVVIKDITITAFPVQHSLRAPAVGYRIMSEKNTIFYVPDLVEIVKPEKALTNVDLYIGDGAIIKRTLLVRTKNGISTGHSPIIDQLAWCQQYGIPRAIITHCGKEIVKQNPELIEQKMMALSEIYHLQASVACDGLVITL